MGEVKVKIFTSADRKIITTGWEYKSIVP